MICPLDKSQKAFVKAWASNRGLVYGYRDWSKHGEYWAGFVRVEDSISRKEYGIHLYDSGEIVLVSSQVKDNPCDGC